MDKGTGIVSEKHKRKGEKVKLGEIIEKRGGSGRRGKNWSVRAHQTKNTHFWLFIVGILGEETIHTRS